METHSIILSYEDAATLSDLLDGLKHSAFPEQLQMELLEQLLDCAEVVPSDSIPLGIIRLHCSVRVVDLQTGKKKRYTLVSPELADMAKRLLSVTAPLAIALLGHKQGDVVDAKVPGGVRRLDITRVRHPPKRAEDRNALLRKYRISQPNRNLTSAPVT